MNIAIIGGGASALMIASKLDKCANIIIFERNKGLGRKLLASGNGKANILNINATKNDYNNPTFVNKVITEFPPSKILDEFHKMGLFTKQDDEGRVYPITESSKTVLDCFLQEIPNTTIIYEYEVKKVVKRENKYQINDYSILFDKVICASGSIAGIEDRKQEIVYKYLKDMNLRITPLNESLVGFKIKDKNIKSLSGYRSKANVKFFINDKLIHEELGEVIFKDDGISGIVIMNMSSHYARNSKPKNSYLMVDLLPEIEMDKVLSVPKDKIIGIAHPKMIDYLNIKNNDLKLLKELELRIIDTYTYQNAQVVSGGIELSQITDKLNLKNDSNIYFAGEVLDIDGTCGGYNLLFAFASGLIVASDIMEKIKYENTNK